jgi:hypothetical protein
VNVAGRPSKASILARQIEEKRAMKGKPILCLDFDGVIHDYKHGWKDGSIYGNVVPGFFVWAIDAAMRFDLIIHSSRASTPAGAQAIRDWLIKEAERTDFAGAAGLIEVTAIKPPAFLSIDDRCIRFDGNWDSPLFDLDKLRTFTPWTVERKRNDPNF